MIGSTVIDLALLAGERTGIVEIRPRDTTSKRWLVTRANVVGPIVERAGRDFLNRSMTPRVVQDLACQIQSKLNEAWLGHGPEIEYGDITFRVRACKYVQVTQVIREELVEL